MTIANDIINGHMPDFDLYVRQGASLDDIDEYGFTPIIEGIITRQPLVVEALIIRGADVNKPDVTGRSALHWAVDNADIAVMRLLLKSGANPNAYTTAGLSVLVYPILRSQNEIKHLLYQYGAKLDFAMDFIQGKLLGHRFELTGDVDIVNAQGEFIELDYEGFILEFSVAMIYDSFRRFTSSYSTRAWRPYFPSMHMVMDAMHVAAELLKLQNVPLLQDNDINRLQKLIQAPMLVLPAASRGHAICFVRYQQWWAKIDRGENSLQEGSVNIYQITRPEVFNVSFLRDFLYKKQSRQYFHSQINQQLGLVPVVKLPISSQVSGNCSWANVQAVLPVGYALQELVSVGLSKFSSDLAIKLYDAWVDWDQDRAIDECIHRFYLADPVRKASLASMLARVLFQTCDASIPEHVGRAEKMLTILTLPQYYYILQSYLDIYCVKKLTRHGYNLLKLLDDCGVNPNIDVTAIATGLKDKE